MSISAMLYLSGSRMASAFTISSAAIRNRGLSHASIAATSSQSFVLTSNNNNGQHSHLRRTSGFFQHCRLHNRPGTSLFMSSSSSVNTKSKMKANNGEAKKVPMTLLSGFLGSGKTTTLEHLLKNNDGIKVGIIVNDVASVNIDAKLVSSNNNGVIELQNGCACCSLADELLTSVDQLLTSPNKGGRDGEERNFDAVVVELSGVADPIAIKSNWADAKRNGHPVTKKADVTQVVTLVDASTFGTDWMTWDLAGERDGWTEEGDDCTGQRKVPELLAEQVEAADVLLINKVDLAGDEQVSIAANLAKQLNTKTETLIEQVSYGKTKTSPSELMLRTIGSQNKESRDDADADEEKHSSHSHNHDHANEENDTVAMTSNDADRDDSTHDHSHAHSHSHATSTDQLGITNFVYKASRPFNLRKLLTLLNEWPVPIKDELDLSLIKEAQEEGYEIQGTPVGKMDGNMATSPFIGVLRSKGFCWFAPTRWSADHPKQDVWRHDTAMYWSHAGKHFGISSAGKWWGSISKTQMLDYFKDNLEEYQRIITEDFASDEFGDRRQEVVFIGVNMDQEAITAALDDCLVSEKGMDRYRQELQNYESSILSSEISGPGLFDVGGVDHMDMEP